MCEKENVQKAVGVQIVPLEKRHLDAVEDIERKSFSVPWSRDSFEDAVAHDFAYFFVAEKDGAVIGYAGMYCLAGEGEILNVAVLDGCRRSGVASALLEKLISTAKEKCGSETPFFLEVRASNSPAVALYEKFGFRKAGIRKKYYREPVEDAFVMMRGI